MRRVPSSIQLTPRGEAWNCTQVQDMTFLTPQTGPSNALELLNSHLPRDSEHQRGKFGAIHLLESRYGDRRLAIKECRLATMPQLSDRAFSKYCGLGALKMNVALERGLAELGDKAKTPLGARITTPQYLGAMISQISTRVLMTYEPGEMPSSDQPEIGTPDERRTIYDEALHLVGRSTWYIRGYDDTVENLLYRPAEDERPPEIVKLDASNHRR